MSKFGTPPNVEKKYEFGKVVRWSAINALFAYGMFEFFMGSPIAGNIISFFTWLMFILYLFAGLASTNKETMDVIVSKEENPTEYGSVPKSVDLFYDVTMMACLTSMGEFTLASIYAVSTIMLSVFQDNYKEAVKRNKNNLLSESITKGE